MQHGLRWAPTAENVANLRFQTEWKGWHSGWQYNVLTAHMPLWIPPIAQLWYAVGPHNRMVPPAKGYAGTVGIGRSGREELWIEYVAVLDPFRRLGVFRQLHDQFCWLAKGDWDEIRTASISVALQPWAARNGWNRQNDIWIRSV